MQEESLESRTYLSSVRQREEWGEIRPGLISLTMVMERNENKAREGNRVNLGTQENCCKAEMMRSGKTGFRRWKRWPKESQGKLWSKSPHCLIGSSLENFLKRVLGKRVWTIWNREGEEMSRGCEDAQTHTMHLKHKDRTDKTKWMAGRQKAPLGWNGQQEGVISRAGFQGDEEGRIKSPDENVTC